MVNRASKGQKEIEDQGTPWRTPCKKHGPPRSSSVHNGVDPFATIRNVMRSGSIPFTCMLQIRRLQAGVPIIAL